MALVALDDDRADVDYARVSDDDRGSAEGVESQHEETAEFAEERGRPLTSSYTDNSLSAFTGRRRPDFERLMADIAQGLIRSVTIWHADRITRDVGEALRIIELFRRHRVRLFSVEKGAEYLLNRASGRAEFIDDINNAAKESGHKGERVTLARKRQAKNGMHGGGIRRFGWGAPTGRVRSKCVNPKAPLEEREYVDVPVLDMTRHRVEEAAEIRLWARELLATRNMAALVAGINSRGVPTVTEADGRVLRVQDKVVDHHGWSGKTVKGILTSPRVSGHSVYQGEIIMWNAWPPILEEETRQAIITLLGDPARVTTPGNTPRWLISKSPGALCGQCTPGGMVTARHGSKGPVYRCLTCHKGAQPADLVDEYVAAVACERLSRRDLVDLVAPPRPEVDLGALRQELAESQRRKTEASLAYARGAIDLEMLETIKAEADRQSSKIRKQLSAAVVESPLAGFLAVDGAEAVAALWETLSLPRRREIVRLLMTVTVGRAPHTRGQPPALDPATLIITPVRPARGAPAGTNPQRNVSSAG
ncbi:recombinase family protein [Streptomyces griseoviridis]